jgi:cytochrome c oxidase assembly factor CtaG
VTWQIAALGGGIAAAAVTFVPPLAHLDHHLLTAHMAQHLLLMLVAAPLILVGIRPARLPQLPPTIGLLAGTATVIVWHVPAVFDLALQTSFWHQFERVSFLAGGLLFWRPVIGTLDWSAPVYLFLATLPCDVLSAFLAFCGHVVYPRYAVHPGMFGLSALEDQELAGALMWVAVTFACLVPALIATGRLLVDARNAVRLR